MKNVLMALVTVFTLAACAGAPARQEILLPTMEVAWEGVREDIVAGQEFLTDPTMNEVVDRELADFDMVFETGDRVGLLTVNWGLLYNVAMAGINERVSRGDFSQGLGMSKAERLNLFTQALGRIVEKL